MPSFWFRGRCANRGACPNRWISGSDITGVPNPRLMGRAQFCGQRKLVFGTRFEPEDTLSKLARLALRIVRWCARTRLIEILNEIE